MAAAAKTDRRRRERQAGWPRWSLRPGPAHGNVAECLRDGYSTAGGLGGGLGAVRRLSSLFDVYAPPGRGTAVLCRLWARTPRPAPPLAAAECGRRERARPRRACVSGDSWAVHQDGEPGRLPGRRRSGARQVRPRRPPPPPSRRSAPLHEQRPRRASPHARRRPAAHARGGRGRRRGALETPSSSTTPASATSAPVLAGRPDGSCPLDRRRQASPAPAPGARTCARYAFPARALSSSSTPTASAPAGRPDDYAGLWAHRPGPHRRCPSTETAAAAATTPTVVVDGSPSGDPAVNGEVAQRR